MKWRRWPSRISAPDVCGIPILFGHTRHGIWKHSRMLESNSEYLLFRRLFPPFNLVNWSESVDLRRQCRVLWGFRSRHGCCSGSGRCGSCCGRCSWLFRSSCCWFSCTWRNRYDHSWRRCSVIDWRWWNDEIHFSRITSFSIRSDKAAADRVTLVMITTVSVSGLMNQETVAVEFVVQMTVDTVSWLLGFFFFWSNMFRQNTRVISPS